MKNPKQPRSADPNKVGYGRPPKANQFRKGRSGNPRGRKLGDENLIAIFKRLATRRVKVNDGGQIKSLSLAEAVILQNYKAALQKDQNAMGNMLRMAVHSGEFKDWSDPAVVGKPLVMPRKMPTDELLAFYGSNVVNVNSSRASEPQED